MNGFVAAAGLLRRAAAAGFSIEYTCLAASIVDGALRIGLILQHQLLSESTEVPDDLLFQSVGDRSIAEREIYSRARRQGVIDDRLFEKLEALYDKRNRVVHRYIISELTTLEVFEIASQFERTLPLVNAAVAALEARQAERGIGMAREGELPGLGRALREMSAEKHGHMGLAKLLDGEGA